MLQLDQVKDSLHAYQLSKRGNALRVMAEAVRWGNNGKVSNGNQDVTTVNQTIVSAPNLNDVSKDSFWTMKNV